MASSPDPNRLNRKLSPIESLDEGFVLLPFSFVINGTSDPLAANTKGDIVGTVTRLGAGKFNVPLKNKPARIFFAKAEAQGVPDADDFTTRCDWTTTAGAIIVKTKTGAVNTDPPDTTVIGGVLVCKKTKRKRSGA